MIDNSIKNFQYNPDPTIFELRKGIFAIIVDNPDSFCQRYSNILDKLKGIILFSSESLSNERINCNLYKVSYNSHLKSDLISYSENFLNMIEDNVSIRNDYELLRMEAERTNFQYKRLQDFYDSVQEKLRQDVKNQNKWTISALLKLIEFRNKDLLEAKIDSFPQVIVNFIDEPFFNYSGAVLVNDKDDSIAAYCGLISNEIFSVKAEAACNYIMRIPLIIDGICNYIYIIADSKDYYFKEYEKSFFLLFSEMITATYNEKINFDALKSAKLDAEQANNLKTQFMANMSHELRTPLNGIFGMIDLLRKNDLNKSQQEQLSLLEYSSNSLLSIINDLLDFSIIEKGKLKLKKTNFKISEILQKSCDLFQVSVKNKSLKLVFNNYLKSELVVKGDPDRLKQVVVNLISNSIKYSNKGTIVIESKVISSENNIIRIQIAVSDEGIGIPQNKLDSIFEEFVQLEDTYTKKHQGVGIGLSIVKQLCLLMGADLRVTSEEGKGTTFTFVMDFEESYQKDEEINQKSHLETYNKQISLLVAEDEMINLYYLEQLFLKKGISVDKAKNGIEVLEKFQKNNYDIAILDIGMPEMNGLECVKKLRDQGVKIPVIALSGYTNEKEIDNFYNSGFNCVLSKPINVETLFFNFEKFINSE